MAKTTTNQIAQLRDAALNGDSDAQYKLGMLYLGRGEIEEELAQAIVWLRKAAEQNDAEAHNSLGHMYLMAGETYNFDEAKRWFSSAAKLGSDAATETLEMLINN